MNPYRSRPLKYPWPTLFYASAVLVAVGLQHVVALRMAAERKMSLQGLGILLAIVGAYLSFWACLTLYRKHTAMLSNRSSSHLVICGPFRLTRNPIYLGYTIFTIGAGLIMDNGWMIVAAAAAATATHIYVIRREEMHLLARFGYEFERYCRRTRVWI